MKMENMGNPGMRAGMQPGMAAQVRHSLNLDSDPLIRWHTPKIHLGVNRVKEKYNKNRFLCLRTQIVQ